MKPTWADDRADLYHGNAFDVLPQLPTGGVDVVITDPPYGMSYQSGRRTESGPMRPVLGDEAPVTDWLPEAARVLRDGGSLLCFHEWRGAEAFREAIVSAGLDLRSQVVWDRGVHGSGNLTAAFAPMHDLAWFATKGAFAFPFARPASVLRHPKVSWQHFFHPTEKPVTLMRDLVCALTRPGELVLDPFAGSGSTGVAAVGEGRRFVGVELDAQYAAIAWKRISGAQLSLGVA